MSVECQESRGDSQPHGTILGVPVLWSQCNARRRSCEDDGFKEKSFGGSMINARCWLIH